MDHTLIQYTGIGPAQDVHFFYARSHLNALQSCASNSPTNFCLFSHLNITRHNVGIEWSPALKIIQFFEEFFSKFTCSFVAIELLTFQKCKIPFLLLKRDFSILDK